MEWPAEEESSESPEKKELNQSGLKTEVVKRCKKKVASGQKLQREKVENNNLPDAVLVVCADDEADIRS